MCRTDRSLEIAAEGLRELANDFRSRVAGNRGDLAGIQKWVDGGDLQIYLRLAAKSSMPELAELALEVAGCVIEHPGLKDVWSHFDHQHLFKLCKSLTAKKNK